MAASSAIVAQIRRHTYDCVFVKKEAQCFDPVETLEGAIYLPGALFSAIVVYRCGITRGRKADASMAAGQGRCVPCTSHFRSVRAASMRCSVGPEFSDG